MALEAAQLLTTVLMLLQTVSANPTLPQSVRDSAATVAQSAITEATRTIQSGTAGTPPSCMISSDKFNYREGEIILFSWMTKNAVSAEFISDIERGNLQTPDIDLTGSGIWRKAATAKGYTFATIKVTGSDGASGTCSHMVSVH